MLIYSDFLIKFGGVKNTSSSYYFSSHICDSPIISDMTLLFKMSSWQNALFIYIMNELLKQKCHRWSAGTEENIIYLIMQGHTGWSIMPSFTFFIYDLLVTLVLHLHFCFRISCYTKDKVSTHTHPNEHLHTYKLSMINTKSFAGIFW